MLFEIIFSCFFEYLATIAQSVDAIFAKTAPYSKAETGSEMYCSYFRWSCISAGNDPLGWSKVVILPLLEFYHECFYRDTMHPHVKNIIVTDARARDALTQIFIQETYLG